MRHDGKSTGLFQDEENGFNFHYDENLGSTQEELDETRYKLKIKTPAAPDTPAPANNGGESTEIDNMGGLDNLDADLSEPQNDKPFNDEPFDAGVEADETSEPEKYIQQLSGKLGQSLRQYTDNMGQPDFDLEKFAINSVISATHTAEMDSQDKKDIINKINSAGANDESNMDDNEEDTDVEEPVDNGNEEEIDELGESDSNFENDSNFGNDKNFENDMQWENTIGLPTDLELPKSKKKATLEGIIKTKLTEMLEPAIKPNVTPKIAPDVKPGRKTRTWQPNPAVSPTPKMREEDTKPKEEGKILKILKPDEHYITISTVINGEEVTMEFEQRGLLDKPMSYDEPWVYEFVSLNSPDGQEYSITASYFGHPNYNMDFDEIEETHIQPYSN